MPEKQNTQLAASLFSPARLTVARNLRKQTMVKLARTVDVEPSAIGQFERGDNRPSPATVRRLALALEVPVNFFIDDSTRTRVKPVASFRRRASATASEKAQALAYAQISHQLITTLERHAQLPAFDLPEYRIQVDAQRSEIENVAVGTRRALNIGSGPVGAIIRRLEGKGVLTLRLSIAEKIFAYCVPFVDRPVVVLGTDKNATDRSRFDVAHELGHLVLHRDLDGEPTPDQEKQADMFAAGFLLPEEEIRFYLPRRLDWNRLLQLKRDWGVSLQALIERCYNLDYFDERDRRNAYKRLSAKGWRTEEPVDLGLPERPTLLSLTVETVSEHQAWSIDDIARASRLNVEDVAWLLAGSGDGRPLVEPGSKSSELLAQEG